MIQCLKRRNRVTRGFTMMEVLVVVGIIAIISSIAIPSIISMNKNMDYRQRCDYAKTIFLAAQSNLADMRSTGELDKLEENKTSVVANTETQTDFIKRYVYTYNDPELLSDIGTAAVYYDDVLPVNAVESVIRDQQVIIEYNPRTGGVYSVFYSEDFSGLVGAYQQGALQRTEEWCKQNLVGYYNGSDRSSEELDFLEAMEVKMPYENDQEFVLNIEIPRQDIQNRDLDKNIGTDRYVKQLEIKLTVIGENGGMFTRTIKTAGESVTFSQFTDKAAAPYVRIPITLDSLVAESSFAQIAENKNGQGFHVQPGDNISLMLEVKFVPERENDPIIEFDDAVLAGINPLFHSLTGDATSGYTIAISNGRHLQNLNAVANDIAKNVTSITFVTEETPAGSTESDEDNTNAAKTTTTQQAPEIDWKDTTSYYMEKHPGSNVNYFAPIDNVGLFGTTQRTRAIEVDGNEVLIRNLKINDAKTSNAVYVNADGLKGSYIGLFRYVSGEIKDLRIVNPVIQGGGNSFAVGALAGSTDKNTTVKGCYVYVDTSADDFRWNNLDITTGFDGSSELKYGVSGSTAVGGMIGQAEEVAFEKCFAAVPVYGDMVSAVSTNNLFGVGGFVGVSLDSSFDRCYSSVRTIGKGSSPDSTKIDCGIGGFVGTSHETTFVNCFASGNVTHISSNELGACGGFVGVTKNTYNTGKFNSCYSVGTVHAGSTLQAKFVGRNISSGVSGNYVDRYKQILSGGSGYIYDGCYYLQGFGNTHKADNDTLQAGGGLLESIHAIQFIAPYTDHIKNAINSSTTKNFENIDGLKDAVDKSAYRAVVDGISVWTSSSNVVTHTYVQENRNKYPYSVLNGMPFYGTWQEAPSEVRMSYWEWYGENDYGIYFDENSTTLQDKTVLADGYMLLSAQSGSNFTVKVDGTKFTDINFNQTTVVDEKTYYYAVLSGITGKESKFYTEVTMNDGTAEYRMYFNPNVAASHINPTGTNKQAAQPDSAPSMIVIRSPRQLNALNSAALGREIVLWGDIDFTKYSDQTLTLPPIGTLTGKITGKATITVESTSGALVNELNGGTISGITLKVNNGMTLEDGAGALVKTMKSGIISGCNVEGTVTGTSNDGLIVGSLEGGTITGTSFIGTNSSDLGFVGTASRKSGSNMISSDANYYSSNKVDNGAYTLDEISAKGLVEIEEDSTLIKQEYAATITEDCTYTFQGKTISAVTGKYYYSISDDNIYTTETKNSISVQKQGKITLSDGFGIDAKDWTKTQYYFNINNELYPLYVKVEKVTEKIDVPEVASELDGTDGNGENDQSSETNQGNNGESGETLPNDTQPSTPQTTYRITYTYYFRLDNGKTLLEYNIQTEKPNETYTEVELYTVNMPTEGEYVFFNGINNVLPATLVPDFDITKTAITDNMIWKLDAGVWTNKESGAVINPELVIPVNETAPAVSVNGHEYYVVKISGSYREVKLVDIDPIYSTTQQPESQS